MFLLLFFIMVWASYKSFSFLILKFFSFVFEEKNIYFLLLFLFVLFHSRGGKELGNSFILLDSEILV